MVWKGFFPSIWFYLSSLAAGVMLLASVLGLAYEAAVETVSPVMVPLPGPMVLLHPFSPSFHSTSAQRQWDFGLGALERFSGVYSKALPFFSYDTVLVTLSHSV